MTETVLVIVLSLAFVALAMAGLGVGLLLRRKGLRGHCGGGRCTRDEDGRKQVCDDCVCDGDRCPSGSTAPPPASSLHR